MKHAKVRALATLRNQVKEEILKSYSTTEQFCWDNELNKATLSNFLNDKKDFRVSTLVQIANALGKRLVIRIE